MYRCLMVAAAVAGLAEPALAQDDNEGGGALVYRNRPSDRQLHEALPAGAPSTDVYLNCLAGAGRLSDCRVLGQNPRGRPDVAVAAAKLVQDNTRIEAKDRAGQDVAGRRFELKTGLMAPGDKDPDWLRKPNPNSLAAVLPVRAAKEGKDGSATISCRVTVEGYLDRCQVVSEDPEGYGFGPAALLLVPQFAMTPKIRGGRPVEGGVRLPIHWKGLGGMSGSIGKNRVMMDPTWKTVPTAAAVKAAYPAKAADLPYGQAALRCDLTDAGQAKSCEVASEIPPSRGFGAAAKSLSYAFTINFAPEEKALLKTTQIDIPFRFRNPTAPDNGAITDPRWTNALTPEGAALLFPQAAREAKLSTGLGVVNCAATAAGALSDCRVMREEPVGKGFGEAALQAASVMRMNLWTKTGDPVEGRRISLPIRFNLEAPKPAAAP